VDVGESGERFVFDPVCTCPGVVCWGEGTQFQGVFLIGDLQGIGICTVEDLGLISEAIILISMI